MASFIANFYDQYHKKKLTFTGIPECFVMLVISDFDGTSHRRFVTQHNLPAQNCENENSSSRTAVSSNSRS
jgi:hypothetical protein